WIDLSESLIMPCLANLAIHRSASIHSISLSFTDNLLYVYESVVGTGDAAITRCLRTIELPADLCVLHSNDRKSCMATGGCSFCTTLDSSRHKGHCFSDSTAVECASKSSSKLSNATVLNGAKCIAPKQSLAC